MDADRARSAPPRRDQDDAVRRVRAVQRRRRRPAQHVDRGDVRDVEVVEAGRHLTSDVESVGIRALICAHAVHVQERRVGHEQARGAAIEQARARADRARALHHHEPRDAPREQLGQRGRGLRGGERIDVEVAHAVAQLDRTPLPGGQGDGALETRPTAAVLLRRQDRGPAAEQRPGDERQPRLRHSRKRARPRGPGKRGPAGWRAGPVRRYRARGATMTSFFKTSETYRQGGRTLPGRYYTSPQIFAEEGEGSKSGISPPPPPAFAGGGGFLMITPARAAERFAQAFAPLVGRFARFNIANLRSARRIDYDVRANWKLIFQNYSECLHCPVIHPELAKLAPYTSGENDLVDGPFLGGYMTITREGGSLSLSGRACGVPVGELPAADLNRAYFYTIFPNLLLSLHPDYVMFHTLWPDGPARTRISCEWLVHRDSLSRPELDPEDGVRFWDMTNRQDWHICEQSQAGVSSRAYVPGPYSPRESVPAAWDREFLRAIGHAP